jgi:hypothetical protein
VRLDAPIDEAVRVEDKLLAQTAAEAVESP